MGAVLAAVIVGVSNYAFDGGAPTKEPRGEGDSEARVNRKPSMFPRERARENQDLTLPAYEVLKDEVYDAPIKTQVELQVLVAGTITETSLRNLMQRLFTEVRQRGGFRYSRSGPTHVFIYAYPDRERAQSGMGQWVAMLSRLRGREPQISINKKMIEVIKQKPVVRFGLTEAERKEIFKELVRAEDRARVQAERQYPLEPTNSLKPGQKLELTKQTALMPELNPRDPIAALDKVQPLQPGTTIHILKVARRGGVPWYSVRPVTSTGAPLGSGWINSIALIGQSRIDSQEQLRKQAGLGPQLQKKYEAEVAKKHRLTREQLDAISVEGLKKQWPFPDLPKD